MNRGVESGANSVNRGGARLVRRFHFAMLHGKDRVNALERLLEC